MFRVVCRRLWVNRRCQAGINCRFEVTQRFFTSEDSPIEAEGYRDLQVLTRHQKQQVSASIRLICICETGVGKPGCYQLEDWCYFGRVGYIGQNWRGFNIYNFINATNDAPCVYSRNHARCI